MSSTILTRLKADTPFWSIWDPSASVAGNYWPRRDDLLYLLALQAVHEYWVTDGNNEIVGGVSMIQTAFMSVWNWDARPFPTFPQMTSAWGDAGNWPAGNWLAGKGPFVPVPVPDVPLAPGPYSTFPAVPTLGWSVTYSPLFSTGSALHTSGREVRAAKYIVPLWSIELNYDLLRMASPNTELQEIIGFFEQSLGEDAPFYFYAADAFTRGCTGAWRRRRRDGDVPVCRDARWLHADSGQRRHGLGHLSQRCRAAERRLHREPDGARAFSHIRNRTSLRP